MTVVKVKVTHLYSVVSYLSPNLPDRRSGVVSEHSSRNLQPTTSVIEILTPSKGVVDRGRQSGKNNPYGDGDRNRDTHFMYQFIYNTKVIGTLSTEKSLGQVSSE